MIIGCPREIVKGEKRVALTPKSALELQKLGYKCQIETKCGEHAQFNDNEYKKAGVKIVKSSKVLWKTSDIIIKVRSPHEKELSNIDINSIKELIMQKEKIIIQNFNQLIIE